MELVLGHRDGVDVPLLRPFEEDVQCPSVVFHRALFPITGHYVGLQASVHGDVL